MLFFYFFNKGILASFVISLRESRFKCFLFFFVVVWCYTANIWCLKQTVLLSGQEWRILLLRIPIRKNLIQAQCIDKNLFLFHLSCLSKFYLHILYKLFSFLILWQAMNFLIFTFKYKSTHFRKKLRSFLLILFLFVLFVEDFPHIEKMLLYFWHVRHRHGLRSYSWCLVAKLRFDVREMLQSLLQLSRGVSLLTAPLSCLVPFLSITLHNKVEFRMVFFSMFCLVNCLQIPNFLQLTALHKSFNELAFWVSACIPKSGSSIRFASLLLSLHHTLKYFRSSVFLIKFGSVDDWFSDSSLLEERLID